MENYTRTFTTFGGADIVATFNGKVIGELQGITYSVSREKAPIYTLGSADPRSFSRGKRGIAGSLIFTVFDRDALMDTLGKGVEVASAAGNRISTENGKMEVYGIEAWNSVTTGEDGRPRIMDMPARYVDQIPPFNITITFANEYGQTAVMRIYGVELLNEGSGMSIDDVVTERACTFVARALDQISRPDSITMSNPNMNNTHIPDE